MVRLIKGLVKWTAIVLIGIFIIGLVLTRQPVIDSMTNRFMKNEATLVDQIHLRSLYGAMLVYGYFVYPEASKTLFKVLFLHQSNMTVNSEFFYNHRDIKKALALGKTKIMYGASASWKRNNTEYYYPKKIEYRIFYAFNPLYLNSKTSKAWFTPYQFTTDWNVETPLKVGWLVDFRLKDALMHKVTPIQGGTVSFDYNPNFNI